MNYVHVNMRVVRKLGKIKLRNALFAHHFSKSDENRVAGSYCSPLSAESGGATTFAHHFCYRVPYRAKGARTGPQPPAPYPIWTRKPCKRLPNGQWESRRPGSLDWRPPAASAAGPRQLFVRRMRPTENQRWRAGGRLDILGRGFPTDSGCCGWMTRRDAAASSRSCAELQRGSAAAGRRYSGSHL